MFIERLVCQTCQPLDRRGGRGEGPAFGGPLPKQYALFEGPARSCAAPLTVSHCSPGSEPGSRFVIGPGDEAPYQGQGIAGLRCPRRSKAGGARAGAFGVEGAGKRLPLSRRKPLSPFTERRPDLRPACRSGRLLEQLCGAGRSARWPSLAWGASATPLKKGRTGRRRHFPKNGPRAHCARPRRRRSSDSQPCSRASRSSSARRQATTTAAHRRCGCSPGARRFSGLSWSLGPDR